MHILKIIIIALLVLNYLCLISVVFIEKKRPTSTVVWVLLLFFLPVISLFIYLAFGSGLRFRKKKRFNIKGERDKQYKRLVIDKLQLSDEARPYAFSVLRSQYGTVSSIDEIDPETVKAEVMEEIKDTDLFSDGLIRYLHKSDLSIYTTNNEVEMFTDGEIFHQKHMQDIWEAKESIHLLYYKINSDSSGQELTKLLAQKASEGVEVRVLYDSLGSFSSTARMFNELAETGCMVGVFFPVRFAFTSYLRLNYRNHRKITVIDGKIGYTGGMNIGDEYRGLDKKLRPWRDTHLRITGDAVLALQERFMMDWMNTYEEDHANLPIEALRKYYKASSASEGLAMQIASSGPDTEGEEIKCAILKLLGSARDYVYLQTPYFIPDRSLVDAMKTAVLSGVDVRLMLPGISDMWFVHYASMSYIDDLLRLGVKVYLFNGFMHAKTAVADGKVCTIGSTNLDIRSFTLDFEVNAFIYDNDFAERCKKIFIEDMENCFEATLEWRNQRGTGTIILESLLRIFSPVM